LPLAGGNPFEGTGLKDERSLRKNVQRNLANSCTAKVRNAVADVTNEGAQNCMLEIDCTNETMLIVEWTTVSSTPLDLA
jgi:hypothetical protein